MLRSAVLVWLSAVSCLDSRAAEPIPILRVSVGESVMLPCPCFEDTKKLVWQIGEEIVVNHCCENKHPLHESYVNRTQVFLWNKNKNCSLLLRDVSLNDSRNFTCYVFDGKENLQQVHVVGLNVTDAVFTTANLNRTGTPNNQPASTPHTGFAVGVPMSLILLILTGLIVVLLIRKHRHRGPRMVVIQDPQAKLAIMNHSTV